MDWFLSLRKKRKKFQKAKVSNVQHETKLKDTELDTCNSLEILTPPNDQELRIPVEINEVSHQLRSSIQKEPSTDIDCLMEKTRKELMKYKWFWPNFSRTEAQKKLRFVNR